VRRGNPATDKRPPSEGQRSRHAIRHFHAVGAGSTITVPITRELHMRLVTGLLLGLLAVLPAAVRAEFAVEEASLAELAAAQAEGTASSQDLVRAYLERIERLDRAGPRLNAVIELNPEALAIAATLDAERAAGTLRGPLHGIPILLKDNIDTGDRMQTSAGSLALLGEPAAQDSSVAARLRAAGAVILGKTNLSEWANFRGRRSSSGWSSRGGQTRNPYALDRTPCGSSSGSGVAAAASLAGAAIGTETDGSIICPAAINGLVGIKPSIGLVSRAGIVPISGSQDTAGPMARSVADAALLLQALVGADPRDRATADVAEHTADYVAALDPQALKGARIGVVRQLAGFHAGVDQRFDAAVEALRAAGVEIVEGIELPTRAEAARNEFTVLVHEFKDDLNAYLATRSGVPATDLDAVIAFNVANAERVLPWFGQQLLEQAAASGGRADVDYQKAQADARRLAGPEGIDKAMAEHRLDALIAPSNGPAWPVDWVNGDAFGGGSSGMAAISGYPNISVPMGLVHGLPVGINFFGARYSEAKLIGYAYAFEQATRLRQPPRYAAGLPAGPQ
jgi:amidase